MMLTIIESSNDSFAALPCVTTTSVDVVDIQLTNDNFAFTEEINDNAYHTIQNYYGCQDLMKPMNSHLLSSLLNNSKPNDAFIIIA
jgi:hypothetical protein